MSELSDRTKYSLEYAKKNLKRIPLDVQKEKYDQIKAAADAAGEKVNSYIKRAVDERMERDNRPPEHPPKKNPYPVPEETYTRRETLDEKMERLRKEHSLSR